MGLAKKLGNVHGQRSLVPDSVGVEYKWSTQSYVMQEILSKFKLPCVVQCATDQCSVVWSKFRFDLRHPILLYSRRTVRKLHARNLTTSTKEEFGPPVAIPEDYEGWFGAAPKGTNVCKRYTRIEGIVDSNTLRFLVCTKCPAFTRSTGPNGSLDYLHRDITPGETFKRVCVMDGDVNNEDTPEIIRDNGPCLECLDEKDEDILIPLSRRAIAYEIADFYPDANHKVFNTKTIISGGNSNLPRILSVVHGERPVLDYAYTGTLRCYSVFTEETILAATLDDQSSIRLELTTDSMAKFKLSLNEASIKRTCEYMNALQLCKTSGDAFLTGIKVSFSLKPEILDDIDLSFYENQSTSDMQEVDANSEFEIAWSSDQNTNSSQSKNSKAKAARTDYKPNISDNFTLVSGDSNDLPRSESKIRSEALGVLVGKNVNDDLPTPPVDFTEQEIANLMVRKGMIQGLGASSSSDLNLTEEIETLRRTRGTKVNPIFISCSDTSPQSIKQYDDTEDEVDGLEGHDTNSSKVPENCDIVEISLDETEFVSAVTTKASEYHDIDSDSDYTNYVIEIDEADTNYVIEIDEVETNNTEKDESEEVMFVRDVDMENGNTKVKPVKLQEFLKLSQSPEEEYTTIESVGADMAELKTSVNIDICPQQDNSDIRSVKDNSDIRSVKDNSDIIVPLNDSSITVPQSDTAVFPRGLNVAGKATSSDTVNRNKWPDRKEKEEGNVLHKFRSESNISKIFDRFKGNESEKNKSKSSKMKLFQLKGPKKSPANTDKTLFTMDMDNTDGLEC